MSKKIIKKIKDLQDQINNAIDSIAVEKQLVKGSYTYVMKKCSNPNCDCHIKPKHPIHRLTWVENRKGKSLSLQKINIAEVKKLIKNYKDFKKTRLKIAILQQKLNNYLYDLELILIDSNSAIDKIK